MRGRPVGSVEGWIGEPWSVAAPLQGADPSAVLGASATVRAPLAFVVVLVLGGALVWRHEPFVDRAVDETMEHPLVAVGYGLAAHAVIAFAGVYLASRLTRVVVSGWNASGVGLLLGGSLLVAAAALGFTIVGATVVELWGARYHWSGVVLGAAIAGAIAVADPTVAAVAWLAVVSTGIGGPVRSWLHASAVDDH